MYPSSTLLGVLLGIIACGAGWLFLSLIDELNFLKDDQFYGEERLVSFIGIIKLVIAIFTMIAFVVIVNIIFQNSTLLGTIIGFIYIIGIALYHRPFLNWVFPVNKDNA